MIDDFNIISGYNANDWGDNVTLDASGCDSVDVDTQLVIMLVRFLQTIEPSVMVKVGITAIQQTWIVSRLVVIQLTEMLTFGWAIVIYFH